MSMNEKELEEWKFSFGLGVTKPNETISRSKCDELLDLIIEWAEANDLGVGGGYREFNREEK